MAALFSKRDCCRCLNIAALWLSRVGGRGWIKKVGLTSRETVLEKLKVVGGGNDSDGMDCCQTKVEQSWQVITVTFVMRRGRRKILRRAETKTKKLWRWRCLRNGLLEECHVFLIRYLERGLLVSPSLVRLNSSSSPSLCAILWTKRGSINGLSACLVCPPHLYLSSSLSFFFPFYLSSFRCSYNFCCALH